jgi:hypothetical protein
MSRKKPARPPAPRPPTRTPLLWPLLAAVVVCAGAALFWKFQKSPSGKPLGQPLRAPLAMPTEELTFNKHIAPIIFENCSGCHRPGQAAPFPLLTFTDVKKHSADILTVTASRYMPPWPPKEGHGWFVGERRLTDLQITMLAQWIQKGSPEGSPSDLPPLPAWKSDWHLGPPDFIVTMPEPYLLSSDGPDTYRNFVIPVPVSGPKYVRAFEFRPGNPKVVHHALIKLDRASEGRRRDRLDPELGFPGMVVPSETGHFLGWQPGRLPADVPTGLAWELRPGDDLVVQMHLSPSGKSEEVQPSIGLYFTDTPPTATPFRILLTSIAMDIPPGDTNYSVSDSYVLPVDTEVLAVLPHAHFLGKQIDAWATLPGGRTEPLIRINDWDFNWQSDYRYATPLSLPKGATLSMKFTFDNSTNNARNPHHPPRRVRYGPQSTDEMAEFWLQVLPKRKEDLPLLSADYSRKSQLRFFEGNLAITRFNPSDATAQSTVGQIYFTRKQFAEAERHLRAAVAADPNHAPGHYGLGLLFRQLNRPHEAETAFEAAARLDPSDPRPHSNLGYIALARGDAELARIRFDAALRINPADPLARSGLEDLARLRR